jgi:hypothetical protein
MVYKINKPDIVFEYFKDETVLINLKSGNYYSIDKVGTDILSLIEKRKTVQQIINSLKNKYWTSEYNIGSSVERFIDRLHNEKIIMREEKNLGEANPSEKKVLDPSKNSERVCFSPPRLSKYTDMQELLLLDPIHDVDETGWPKKKPDKTFNEK